MSNETLVVATSVSPGPHPTFSSIPSKRFITLRCETTTPFGAPVVPLV